MGRRMGIRDGWALDLTQIDPEDGKPWDFNDKQKREKVARMIDADKPMMLIACPMCGPFSQLQQVFNYPGMPEDEVREKLRAALEHLKFAAEMCIKQHDAGRLFLFEHPASASSWGTAILQYLAKLSGVHNVRFDFCALGMKTVDNQGREAAAKKRTGVLTNSQAVADLLQEAQCRRDHRHQQLLDGRAGPCQKYTDKFCRLVCEGIKRELATVEWKNRMTKTLDISTPFGQLMRVQERMEAATPPEEDPLAALYDGADFFDDVTGAPMDKHLATEARRLEIEYFRKMGVYTKVRREKWMKVITTRWIDTNKGDERVPDYRARLVGREIKRDRRDDLFAATPPLESLRMILSICSSNQQQSWASGRFAIMSNDVKRAYFYAPVTRPVYLEIPAEDYQEGDGQGRHPRSGDV